MPEISAHQPAAEQRKGHDSTERNRRMLARLSTFLDRGASSAAAARVLLVVADPLHPLLDGVNAPPLRKDADDVELGAMVATLSSLLHSGDGNSNRVMLSVHAAPVRAQISLARPILLAVYELVSNALQHAFPLSRTGVVSVTLFESDGQLRTSVADDGVGLPMNYRSRGGGIASIERICANTGGHMRLQTDADAHLTRFCCCCEVVARGSRGYAFPGSSLPN